MSTPTITPSLTRWCFKSTHTVASPDRPKVVAPATVAAPAGCDEWENLGPLDDIRVAFPQLVRQRLEPAGGRSGGGVGSAGSGRGRAGSIGNANSGSGEWTVYSSCGVDCYAKHGATVLVNTRQLLVGQQRIDAAKLSSR